MSRQVLRDERSFITGYIDTESSGRQVLSDAGGKKLGYYEPKAGSNGNGITIDMNYRRVGEGNLLTSLLPVRR